MAPSTETSAVVTSKASASLPGLSKRITEADDPIMIQMRKILSLNQNALSLGQGIVYWLPPAEALEAARQDVYDPACSSYGIDDGIAELREALVQKVKSENNLLDSSIMVTAGAQQAFLNIVLAVCDPSDSVVLFKPYYFSHQIAFQMTGVTNIVYGPCDSDTLYPDADWLESALTGQEAAVKSRPKVVVVTNPNNPSGTYVPPPLLQRIADICRQAGVWLILDNTYEYFMYDGRKHVCAEGPNIINIFSFSKAYGMMGWRVGYIAYPNNPSSLGPALLKVQDTVPICPTIVAQRAALAALRHAGRTFVDREIARMLPNRQLALDALMPLGREAVKGGEGGIYFWARLPAGSEDGRPADDVAIVRWLADRHGVVVVPGSACGGDGFIRVAFANLHPDRYREAAARLKRGLQELVAHGMVTSDDPVTTNDVTVIDDKAKGS